MKKTITVLFLLFIIAGCSKSIFPSDLKQVDVFEMASFSETVDESLRTFTNEDDIGVFTNAFETAKKEQGIADMADPQYKVILGDKTYFMWLPEEAGDMKGSIMDVTDTHTLYVLSRPSTDELVGVLKK
ncbi:hypothetical protein JOC95_003845 [Bacillus tianshenii]|uniref:YhfM-like domain-containing protein n=1 Tax=Sutcliffiella tianshenii TaxID=1463404 RepID=A0ABS2P4Q1_9BACI|nr:fimbrillin family protein [Bacillus tianshenii]MBM7621937.1 hypothetical protein [Bacillus tianshenii]